MKKQFNDCIFANQYIDEWGKSCGALKEHYCIRGCYQDRLCPFYKSKRLYKIVLAKMANGEYLRIPVKKI